MQYAAVILASLSLALAAPAQLAARSTGDLTFYEVGLGSCGITSQDSQYVVAISHIVFDQGATPNPNNNPHCGKTVNIKYGGKTATAKVVDRCTGCAAGDLDASPSLFQHFAPESAGRLHGMTWTMN